jgi:hypothetical protein
MNPTTKKPANRPTILTDPKTNGTTLEGSIKNMNIEK